MAEFIIPDTITVHLGPPQSNAPNVTVPFPDYAANVASSEIYPTWPDSALRANIYAQVSFALNRIYTEWYRAQGYDFDITSSTAYDQSFVNGRDIFDNVQRITDELFDDYLRRPGALEPLAAKYCNGTTVTCDGLSQWGSVTLANQGQTPYEILTHYYGPELDIVRNAPVGPPVTSFLRVLRRSMVGDDVRRLQIQLNRVGQNYPAIPKVPVDGFFGEATEASVRQFQEIFGLTADSVVGSATWYKLSFLYVNVKLLSELYSEGERLLGASLQYTQLISEGDTGGRVSALQFFLAVLSNFYAEIPFVRIDGTFGPATRSALLAAQRLFDLPQTGVVSKQDWETLYDETAVLLEHVPPERFSAGTQPYPGFVLTLGMRDSSVAVLQSYLVKIAAYNPAIPATTITGYFGPKTKAAVTAFQRQAGLTPDGVVGEQTWNALVRAYDDATSAETAHLGQSPGRTLREGDADAGGTQD